MQHREPTGHPDPHPADQDRKVPDVDPNLKAAAGEQRRIAGEAPDDEGPDDPDAMILQTDAPGG